MSEFKYFPLIKTRDAEIRCFENLDSKTLLKLLPIYELTKSRNTTKTPDGDIHRRMNKITEIQGNRPFILDLCTDVKYMNPQIEQLLSKEEGFLEWKIFIFEHYSNLNIIPMIHIHENESGSFDDVKSFVEFASKRKPLLAIRLPYDLDNDDYSRYLTPIKESLGGSAKLIVILDAGQVQEIEEPCKKFGDGYNACRNTLQASLEDVVMLCSSFPSSPASETKKDPNQRSTADFKGQFKIYEEDIYQQLRQQYPFKYGDYASINTEQIEIKGGTFIPRIDISLTEENLFIYKRHRREEGSYPLCATNMIKDDRYTPIDSWADKEIEAAKNNNPNGISPSFWISVRMNYYIKTRLKLRMEN